MRPTQTKRLRSVLSRAVLLLLVMVPLPSSAEIYGVDPAWDNLTMEVEARVSDGFNEVSVGRFIALDLDESGVPTLVRVDNPGIFGPVAIIQSFEGGLGNLAFSLDLPGPLGTLSTTFDFISFSFLNPDGPLAPPLSIGERELISVVGNQLRVRTRGSLTLDGAEVLFDAVGHRDNFFSTWAHFIEEGRIQFSRDSLVDVCFGWRFTARVELGRIGELDVALEVAVASESPTTQSCTQFSTAFAPTPPGPGTDLDSDGIPNWADNCPESPNSLQENADHDLLGDVCDPFPSDFNNAQAQCETDLSVCEDAVLNEMCDLDLSSEVDLVDSVFLRRILAGVPVP